MSVYFADESKKTVVWIDPNFGLGSPIMQRFCQSIDHFRDRGWTIEVWCSEFDDLFADKVDVVHRMPIRFKRLEGILRTFLIRASIRRFRDLLTKRKKVIYHSTKGCCFGATISSHNFSGIEWMRIFFKLRYTSTVDWLTLPMRIYSLFLEAIEMYCFRPEWIIANSNGLRDSIKSRYKIIDNRCVFVRNQIEKKKYNVEIRTQSRDLVRERLGYGDDDEIVMFVSQGHLTRKGWYDLVKEIKKLREARRSKNLHLICVGFNSRVERRAISFLNKHCSDWPEWLKIVGPTRNLNEYLSAADIFAFPSYFESCANVAQEACAMGVPCVLGDYYGADLLENHQHVKLLEGKQKSIISKTINLMLKEKAFAEDDVDMSRAACEPAEWAEEICEIYNQVYTIKFKDHEK